jgi:aspartyl-tRNA(Asn)/glutamyl-tRNA(Gln) amidotransferase subunit B
MSDVKYETIIGLEVHAELNTKSKIYCSCKNSFEPEVNSQVCPVCMGFPGTLPTLNETVVDYAIKMGHALGCTINSVSKQDRKNYFYPDLPKAYQISQSEVPLCEHGKLSFLVGDTEKTVRITRIHIEEDAGKLLHSDNFGGSLCDYNRCGVPLIEIVSEPDLRSGEEANAYLDTIKAILQYLDISDCKMQEGSIRCDVNVSVRPVGQEEFGTRTEMKNVNSFSAAVRGIKFETDRQIEILENGGKIEQETRRWDDVAGESVSMRSKENSQDYRYFPEPDLKTIVVADERISRLKDTIPELPNAKILRYVNEFKFAYIDAVTIAGDMELAGYFDVCASLELCSVKGIKNWLLGDISAYRNKGISLENLTERRLCELIAFIEKGDISNSTGKKVFEIILEENKSPAEIIKEHGFIQIADTGFIENIVDEVFASEQKSVEDYKRGKTNAMGYLVGQCMKKSGGKAKPDLVKAEVLRRLTD